MSSPPRLRPLLEFLCVIQTQWEHPKGVTVKKQPPPPSSLPPRSVSYEMREHEKWMHITNDPKMGEYWFNVVTKETQRDRPACCMKYPK